MHESVISLPKAGKSQAFEFWTCHLSARALRRHSRVLYLPLDRTIVDLYNLQKGDKIKAVLLEVIKAPQYEEESEDHESNI